MVSNDKNSDNPQSGHIVNYEDLETQVIEAIKKKSTLDLFKDKMPGECKYMQKVAEIYLSWDGIILTLSTFISAIGVTYIFYFLPIEKWLFVIFGGILLIFGYLLFSYRYKFGHKFQNYRYIIFEAEKKMLEGSGQPMPQKETINIISQTHNNSLSTDYIKAQLELIRLIMAGFLGGLLVLANSILKTDMPYIELLFAFILTVILLKLMKDYKQYSNKLNKK